jgi:hypothetical protein
MNTPEIQYINKFKRGIGVGYEYLSAAIRCEPDIYSSYPILSYNPII